MDLPSGGTHRPHPLLTSEAIQAAVRLVLTFVYLLQTHSYSSSVVRASVEVQEVVSPVS